MSHNPSQTVAETLAAKIAKLDSLRAENAAPETGGFVRRLAAELAQREAR
jgi:hypothetical protein